VNAITLKLLLKCLEIRVPSEETGVMLFGQRFDLKQRFVRCRVFRLGGAKQSQQSCDTETKVATAIAFGIFQWGCFHG
jgi:hypothetical protein